jgi:hypothetical protein
MNKQQQEKLDQVLRGICKERKVAVEADLDTRLSYRDKDPKNPKAASWDCYSRFLLSDGHTAYIALRTMKASVSSKPDKFAIAKVERRLAKQKKRNERKAAKEAKAATMASKKTLTDADVDRMSESEAKKLFNKTVSQLKSVVRKAKKGRKAAKPELLDGIPVRPVTK